MPPCPEKKKKKEMDLQVEIGFSERNISSLLLIVYRKWNKLIQSRGVLVNEYGSSFWVTSNSYKNKKSGGH